MEAHLIDADVGGDFYDEVGRRGCVTHDRHAYIRSFTHTHLKHTHAGDAAGPRGLPAARDAIPVLPRPRAGHPPGERLHSVYSVFRRLINVLRGWFVIDW